MKRCFVLCLVLAGIALSCIYFISFEQPAQTPINIGPRISPQAGNPNEFFLYHQSIRTPSGQTAPQYPPNYRANALLKARQAPKASPGKSTHTYALNWIERGPHNVSGRARTIIPDPADPTLETWYVGSASGGLWRTENQGQDWEHLTETLTNLATTTLAISPSNPDIIYAGTGEGFGRTMVYGQGIWKSINRGSTWTQIEATANDARFTNIMRLVSHPENPNLIVAATAEGVRNAALTEASYLFRTTDGGLTWSQTYQSNGTLYGGRIEQVIASPNSFDTLYAAINSEGILKSTDAGISWNLVYSVPADVGRIEIAVSPSNPAWIYASAQIDPSGSRLYVSIDAGQTWNVTRATNGHNINWMGQQGWYNNTIAVHPFDEKTVYTGGIDLMKISVSPDFTTIISPLTDGYRQYSGVNSKGVHVDHHGITLIPMDSSRFLFLNANDGGISFSRDAGATFSQTGEPSSFASDLPEATNPPLFGLNTTQFYGADKRNGSDVYIGGTQDNGSWRSPVNPSDGSTWIKTTQGDGFEVAWHYTDPNKVIGTSQFNIFWRSNNGGESWSFLDVPGISGPFITRLAKSNQDPDLLFAVDTAGVVISEDFGLNWEMIQPEGWEDKTTQRHLIARISLASSDVVWAGSHLSGDSTLFVSIDGGSTFNSTNSYSLRSMGPVSGLATHPSTPHTAYALFSYANAPKVLRTTNLGESWEDLSGFGTGSSSTNGFPDVATYCLVVMPFNEQHLWAGTEIGLIESLDGGSTWHLAQNGLPAVAIWQMRIVNDEVVLATHGRGIWSVQLDELHNYEPPPKLLRPVISDQDVSPNGIATFAVSIRQPADSTVIFLDNSPVYTLAPNPEPLSERVALPLTTNETRRFSLQAITYLEHESAASRTKALQSAKIFEPQPSFATNFSTQTDAFLLDGFSLDTPTGFTEPALHTSHPYSNETRYTAELLVPIIVSGTHPILSYDEIALVQPGASSEFGDPQFYDYVIVEATSDGIFWRSLIDGYDARANPQWMEVYTNDTSVDSNLFTSRQIDLTDSFAPGEVIRIRFRLFANTAGSGWGWVIDNLSIQEPQSVNSESEEVAATFQFAANYPNPFSSQTTFAYSLTSPSPVQLTVYDQLGRRVQTLINSSVAPAGEYTYTWETSSLASGTYHVTLKTNEGTQARMITKY